MADEAKSLKDEVDVLRQNEEKVKKYETTIESYKRKLEDMTDLRRTVCSVYGRIALVLITHSLLCPYTA